MGGGAARRAKPRIHVFIATSPIHMKKKLRMTEEQVKEETAESGRPGQGLLRRRRVLARGRQPLRRRLPVEVCQLAVDNGATTLNIPDTVGYGVPEEYAALIRYVIENVDGDYVVSTHCHNDLGLAVANSLAGVAAGARQVECAINGLGERAGNAALEEVVMALRTRADYFGGVAHDRAHRGAGPHVAAGGAAHRLPGAVQQGDHRAQRVRARSRASTSTACSKTARPTRSSTRRPSARKRRRSCWASTRAGTPSPTRWRRWGCTCRATR